MYFKQLKTKDSSIKTKTLALMGLLIAMQIVLERFFSIQTPILRIGFGFIPIVLAAIMLGPILAGVMAMLSDIVGMMLFPQGLYFPGFTVSAFLSGLIYGLILYQKPKSIFRIALAVVIVTLFIDLGLNTLWLSMITAKAALVLLVPRTIKSLLMIPVNVFLIQLICRYTAPIIQSKLVEKA